jgi:hypothetical protein
MGWLGEEHDRRWCFDRGIAHCVTLERAAVQYVGSLLKSGGTHSIAAPVTRSFWLTPLAS